MLAAAGAAVAVWLLRPEPVPVETALAFRGPMQVTIDEDGETRAHDRFTIAAPVSGFLSRIELHEGDTVGPDTVLATIRPLPVDARELSEIRARIAAAEAKQREAVDQVGRWESDLAQAGRERDRLRNLARERLVAAQDLEQAEAKYIAASKELAAAQNRAEAASAEVARERAGLVSQEPAAGNRVAALRAPARNCRVLRVLEKSERVVAFGTPIVMLSNPSRLEVVADVLSTDAVKVAVGAPATIENWGGSAPVRAQVRTVEPYGFTKVSVLGVEEQRVNVVLDFVDPPPTRLGDGYRVDVRIVIWQGEQVLQVPASSVFRDGSGEGWAVFVSDANGYARHRDVRIGERNAVAVVIDAGVEEGAEVILHPPNELVDGTPVLVTRKQPSPPRQQPPSL